MVLCYLIPERFVKKQCVFIGSLYKSELELEMEEKIFSLKIFQNLSGINKELESALSLGELYRALQSMESGKTPGMDGLPVDFLKTFWSEIGVDLLEVFNDSLLKGGLPLSCEEQWLLFSQRKEISLRLRTGGRSHFYAVTINYFQNIGNQIG